MSKESTSISLEFEILKLVFFIVTYLLITDGINSTNIIAIITNITTSTLPHITTHITPNGYSDYSSFYNTLFIFSASTWIDYLSELKHLKKRYYDGRYEISPYISLIGSLLGIVTVSISLFCLCKKGTDFLYVAMAIYYISLIFIFLKAFVIADIIVKQIKN